MATPFHDIDSIRQLRDEIRVQLHLARGDVKAQFDRLEDKWIDLEHRVKAASEQPRRDIDETAKKLVDELRDGYRQIRRAIS